MTRDTRRYEREGLILKACRLDKNLTQTELATRIRARNIVCTTRMIAEYEQGRCIPPGDRLAVILDILEISSSRLNLPTELEEVS